MVPDLPSSSDGPQSEGGKWEPGDPPRGYPIPKEGGGFYFTDEQQALHEIATAEDSHREMLMHVEEGIAAHGAFTQWISTNKKEAAAFAAATVLVAAVGMGVWAAKNGGDDSTGAESATTTVESESSTTESPDATTAGAAVDPSSDLILGERWVVYAKNSQGHRGVGTQFDSYFAGLLVFADGQEPDTQHPRYVLESGIVTFTDVDQPGLGAGCTYSGAASLNAVEPTHLFVEGKAGYLEFDLTEDEPTYWSQLIVTGLDWTLTHTCPETESSQNYGDPKVWVDTGRSGEGHYRGGEGESAQADRHIQREPGQPRSLRRG